VFVVVQKSPKRKKIEKCWIDARSSYMLLNMLYGPTSKHPNTCLSICSTRNARRTVIFLIARFLIMIKACQPPNGDLLAIIHSQIYANVFIGGLLGLGRLVCKVITLSCEYSAILGIGMCLHLSHYLVFPCFLLLTWSPHHGIWICAELLVSCGYLTCGSESLVRTNS
jgi:hypothetical protein